jgi:hypothetical protein
MWSFYDELLVSCPSVRLQDHPLCAVHSYSPYLEVFSPICNLGMSHAMVTMDPLKMYIMEVFTVFASKL